MTALPARRIKVHPRGEDPITALFAAMRPRRVRSLREFAEEEIEMPPGGRYAGEKFSCSLMPWSGLLFDMFSAAFAGRSLYRRFVLTADVQDGKTTLGIKIPLIYTICELCENAIFGAPDADMAQDKFEEDVKQMLLHSRFANLLPKKGRGSRGGKSKTIQFQNGVRLRFMGAGGGDAQIAAFTARVIFATELDSMDQPGQVSRGPDPITKLEARSASFDQMSLFFGEGTLSNTRGRTNLEIINGTDTKIHIPCPHCGEYVTPEREHFSGWQDAADILAAKEDARYVCQKCETPWTETDRRKALERPVLLSRGQEIDKDGVITGEAPRTNTFSFRWNAMLSSLKSQAYIAEREYAAERSDEDNPKKALFQYTWALPWDDSAQDLSGINRNIVLKKIGPHARGMVPEGAETLVVFIDIGKWTCWWTAWAWREDAKGYLIDYGAITVPQGKKTSSLAILEGLRSFRDDILAAGWQTQKGRQITHKLCVVDSRYAQETVYRFVSESGQARYRASKGFGSGRDQEAWKQPKAGKGKLVGHQWFVSRQPGRIRQFCMNADFWKAKVHEGFFADKESPGNLQLYKAPEREHLGFTYQIIAERQLEDFESGRGRRVYWYRVNNDNHYLDCTYGCMAAADYLGIRPIPPKRHGQRLVRETKTTKRVIRTRY